MHTDFGSFEDDAVWPGTLDFLRIDPTVSGDATFAIDYIRFYDSAAIPEPGTTALLIGFRHVGARRSSPETLRDLYHCPIGINHAVVV